MKASCMACGVEKDTDVPEFYTQDDRLVQDVAIDPLFMMCCGGSVITSDEPEYDPEHPTYCHFRQVVVCHSCFYKLDPDMWIGRSCWETLEPRIPFERLPHHDDSRCGGDREAVESCLRELEGLLGAAPGA